MKYNILLKHILILVILTFAFADLSSQQFDCKGKDFWFTFMPNFHNGRGSNDPRILYGDSLYIYIASEKPVNGSITYRNISGTEFVEFFSLPDTNKIHTFAISYYDVELLGYNNSGMSWNRNQCESIAKQSFHIETDEDVSVYALSQANWTSDAFFVFPTDILGEDHVVMSYYSDGTASDSESRTPSQFAVVATEDSTVVDIKAKVPTYVHGRNQSWSIVLNKGDVYLVQASFSFGIPNPDLTGSEILSNKPIAVFAGQQRAKLPINILSLQPSRDILIEQLQPFKNWGKNAFIVPFFQSYDISPFGKDLFRVLAGRDSTDVYLNGVKAATLNKGEFFEGAADRTYVVTSNKPVSVAQFKKTSKFSGSDRNTSDPFMLIIPPKEQYQTSYRIINAQSLDLDNSYRRYKAFSEQYITLIVPDTAISSVRIDKQAIAPSRFYPIQTSGYSYLNYSTTDGVHSIYCNAPIGVYVYGYGDANSYGYLGGMNFIPLNFKAPRIIAEDTCSHFYGRIEKYSKTDFGVWDIKVTNSNNVDVTWPLFTPPADTLRFRAELINKNLDADFKLNISDSLGNFNERNYLIPGFTVSMSGTRIPQVNVPDTIPVIYDTLRARAIHNRSISLWNYGKFLKRVNNPRFSSSEITIKSSMPMAINPKSTTNFNYSIFTDDDTTLVDTLYLNDGCNEKAVVILNIRIYGDRKSPIVEHFHSPCDTMRYIIISDSSQFDFGIDKVRINYVLNGIVDYVRTTVNISEIKFIQNVKAKDAIISLTVTDSSGNSVFFSDTIPGHNLEILGFADDNNHYSFGLRPVGFLTCDSIVLRNKGIPDIIINKLVLSRNLDFEIPASQLPFVIPGGQTKALFVCYKPSLADKKVNRDTMRFIFNCIEESITLEGTAEKLSFEGKSICDADLSLISKKVPSGFFVDAIYPNPISETLFLKIGLHSGSVLKFKIFNLTGDEVLATELNFSSGGYFEVRIGTNELPAGSYILMIDNGLEHNSRGFSKLN